MVKPERVFISIDMEGVSSIVSWAEVDRNNSEYAHARKIMASDLNAAIEGALDAGSKEIVVSDAHGGMRNLHRKRYTMPLTSSGAPQSPTA